MVDALAGPLERVEFESASQPLILGDRIRGYLAKPRGRRSFSRGRRTAWPCRNARDDEAKVGRCTCRLGLGHPARRQLCNARHRASLHLGRIFRESSQAPAKRLCWSGVLGSPDLRRPGAPTASVGASQQEETNCTPSGLLQFRHFDARWNSVNAVARECLAIVGCLKYGGAGARVFLTGSHFSKRPSFQTAR